MDNKGFETSNRLKYLQKANFEIQMDEKEENKRPRLTQNRILVILIVACCIFTGAVWFMQVINRKETENEFSKVIEQFRHLQNEMKTNIDGRNNVKKEQSENAVPLKKENKRVVKNQIANIKKLTKLTRAKKELWRNMRLPPSIFPNYYSLIMDVDMERDIYESNVTINVNVLKKTDVILLHMVGLQINQIEIKNTVDMSQIGIENSFNYRPNEFFVIETDTVLQDGQNYNIKIHFSAKLSKELNGFYASYDVGRKVASTFFSPISARKAFPCFDEPSFKANFSITLRHNSIYKALSNMKVNSVSTKNNISETKFATTLKMSTYLVAWVISEYNYIESKTDKRIRAWAYDVDDVRFGLEASTKLLHFYEEYFQIPYPLEKLDLLTIPNFSPGAMENWGIITFRAERFLINPKTSTQILRQKSFFIMAHELVHQWFGNLVTMSFWNDAWLKESFANNIGAMGGHRVDPSMGVKEQVFTMFMIPALEVDAYSMSHAISTPVKTSGAIRGIFDIITYNKGSCLIDLLHHYLGEKDFRKGLQTYLNTYAYKNANQDNLWKELSEVSGKDVKSIMDTWTLQMGFPLVTVTRLNKTHVKVNQERFSLDPPDINVPTSRFNYIWKVPLIFKDLKNDKTVSHLLEVKEAVLDVPEEYFILNPDHWLYYRVKYDDSTFERISTILKTKHTALTAQDRTGIISDQFSLVAANQVDVKRTLDLLTYLKDETDFYPWQVAFDQLAYIHRFITDTDVLSNFNRYIRKLTYDRVRQFGWKTIGTANDGQLQELILSQACQPGSNVYFKAKRFYINWMFNKRIGLRPGLHPVFKTCVISSGPEFYWQYAYLRFTELKTKELIWSLAATYKKDNILRLLNDSLNSAIIDSQYTTYIIEMIAERSRLGQLLCWHFIKENWKTFYDRYGTDIFMLPGMLSSVLDSFSTEEELNDVKNFFNKGRSIGSGKSAVQQAIIKIKGNIEWKKNNMDEFKKWLGEQDLNI